MKEQVQIWRFTFLGDGPMAGYCKPIKGTFVSTRKKMFKMYGPEWAFQYSEKEWQENVSSGRMYEVDTELVIADKEDE